MAEKQVVEKEAQKELPEEEIYIKEEFEPWDAKPLTVEGTLRLLRWFGELADNAPTGEQLAELRDGGTGPILSMMGTLSPEALVELLSIVTQQTAKEVQDTYCLKKVVRALLTFWQGEELGEIFAVGKEGGEG